MNISTASRPSMLLGAIVLLAILAAGPEQAVAQTRHTIEFDATGRLLSAPPTKVLADDTYLFATQVDEVKKQTLREMLDHYVAVIQGIQVQVKQAKARAATVKVEVKPLEDKAKELEDEARGLLAEAMRLEGEADKARWNTVKQRRRKEAAQKNSEAAQKNSEAAQKRQEAYLKKESAQPFGISVEEMGNVKKEMCNKAYVVLKTYVGLSDDANAATYRVTLETLGCTVETSLHPKTEEYSPHPDDLTAIKYEVVLKYFTESGAFSRNSSDNRISDTKPLTLRRDGFPHELSALFGKAPEGTARVEYEFRRKNTFSDALVVYSRQHRFDSRLQTIVEATSLVGVSDTLAQWTAAAEAARKALGELGQNPPPEVPSYDYEKGLIQLNEALMSVLKKRYKISKATRDTEWVKKYLWLTKGEPKINPFASSASKELLKKKQQRFAQLDAEVKTLELLATNDGFQLAPSDIEELAEVRKERDQLAKEIPVLKGKVAKSGEAGQRDFFLYRGLLYLKRTNPYALMQHHNAENKYVTMARRPVLAVTEDEKLYVLVANEKPDTELSLDVTVTPITEDVAPITEELALSDPAAEAFFMVADTPQDDAKKTLDSTKVEMLRKFVKVYDRLKSQTDFLKKQLSVPALPLEPSEDKTPERVTTPVPYELPVTAPATVAYSIKKKMNDTTAEVGKGSYRLNKLYRLRFRSGLVYSFLRDSDYTLTTETTAAGTDTTLVSESDAFKGIDATLGVQIFLGRERVDIRNRDDWVAPFSLFLGSSISEPGKSFYAGVGLEPISGLTLMGGWHIGEIEKLDRVDGKPVGTSPHWPLLNRFAAFGAFTVDVRLFRQLFDFTGLFNPDGGE